jgi:N-acetylglucosaminyldiphosphoundecaprenol N-acetyl-beta-D-mannosaminyltransferase
MPIEGTPFLGLTFANLTLDKTVDWVRQHRSANRFAYVVTPNVDHRVRLDALGGTPRGDELWSAYHAAGLCLCDSRVLRRLARMFGHDVTVVPGSDLTAQILAQIDVTTPVAIIGSDDAAVATLIARYGLTDSVHYTPPMAMLDKPEAMAATVDFMASAAGRLIFVAVGSPQSEILCYRAALTGRCSGVALCIGASIDFLTGKQQRAPQWMQRTGLEWLHRLVSEPSRMWRRYLVEGPKIFRIALREAKSTTP